MPNVKLPNRRQLLGRVPRLMFDFAILVTVIILLLPFLDVVYHGLPALSWEFVTTSPQNAGRAGGIAPILVSTALIVGVSLVAAIPLAFGTSLLLSEYLLPTSIWASIIRSSLDILAGVPSVVFGLFGLSLLCRQLGLGYSILAGGLTLACMILPTLTRTMYAAFEALGNQYRIAGSALGLPRISVLLHLSLPLALPAITAGVVLGLTRALAETAVLLFTSGYSDRMPESLLDSGRSISLHIYELTTNVPGGHQAAYGSALVLLILLGILSVCMHFISHRIQRRFILLSNR